MNTNKLKIGEKVYALLLSLYPDEYRTTFREEMLWVLSEMYAENTKSTYEFWFLILLDTGKSVLLENRRNLMKQHVIFLTGQKIQINRYNIFGGVFLLPIIFVTLIDIVSRISEQNIAQPNTKILLWLYQTPLYNNTIVTIWVLLFPTAAILVNIAPLLIEKKNHSFHFMNKANRISYIIISLAILFLCVIKMHDLLPCLITGMLNHQIDLSQLLTSCQSA
jgi:hypothetical protein